MAAVTPAAEQAKELLQNLSLDPKNTTNNAPDDVKKNTGTDATNNAIPPYDKSLTPLLKDYSGGSMGYTQNGYPSTNYYGGYDGTLGEWGKDYPRYVNPKGVEISPGFYGDMYHHGYGYAPYGPYPSPGSPAPTLGHDGQLYGPQHYQFPARYYQSPNPTSTPFTNQAPSSKGNISTSVGADQPPVSVSATKSNSNIETKGNLNGKNGSIKAKPSQQNSSTNSNGIFGRGSLHCSGYQDPRFGFEGAWTPVPWFDGHMFPDGQQRPASKNSVSSTAAHVNSDTTRRDQHLHPFLEVMGAHTPRPTSGMGMAGPRIIDRVYRNNQIYSQNPNAFKGRLGFGSNAFDSRMNGQWGIAHDNKYKPRGQGNGLYNFSNENLDGLTELNRGPRAGRFRNQDCFGQTFTIAVKSQSLPAVGNVQDSSVEPDRDQYNHPDFPVTYSDAKFFVIKSYSEDDVHKSIKYNTWASTPNGNKKLDAAYQEAKEKTIRCPVFLFFSVNTSGQFVGVAEMTGPIDFNKTMEYWQQDKWTGCFPVKWHIIKDVPNSILKHITLDNNDNKPVTNSRDTQEVKLEQGLQVLKLFKEHTNRTCILDDFKFYETCQKVMQEKRSKQQQFQKRIVDVKHVDSEGKDKDGTNGKSGLPMLPEVAKVLNDPAHGGLGELVVPKENGVVAAAEKRALANGVAC